MISPKTPISLQSLTTEILIVTLKVYLLMSGQVRAGVRTGSKKKKNRLVVLDVSVHVYVRAGSGRYPDANEFVSDDSSQGTRTDFGLDFRIPRDA